MGWQGNWVDESDVRDEGWISCIGISQLEILLNKIAVLILVLPASFAGQFEFSSSSFSFHAGPIIINSMLERSSKKGK